MSNSSVLICRVLPEPNDRVWSARLLVFFGLAGCILWLLVCLIGVSVVIFAREAQRWLTSVKTASSAFVSSRNFPCKWIGRSLVDCEKAPTRTKSRNNY